jgi:hypothetical protein
MSKTDLFLNSPSYLISYGLTILFSEDPLVIAIDIRQSNSVKICTI